MTTNSLVREGHRGQKREKNKMKSLIVGYGQLGKALYRILSDKYEVDWMDKEKKEINFKVDVMHICFPMVDAEEFINTTIGYIEKYRPEHVIIESTVLPSTTQRIADGRHVVLKSITYSPCRGQHDNLYFDLMRYDKYIACLPPKFAKEIYNYYTNCGLKVRIAPRPEILELVKLLDVVSLGVYSAWALHEKKICDKYGVDSNWVREFGRQTEEFYKKRPDIYPPERGIGGSCVVEDTLLLKKISDSGFLDLIEKIGKKGEGE